MKPRLPGRIRSIQDPVVPIIADLIQSHPGTVSLGQGVVHYGPPNRIKARITEFLADPSNHRYQPDWGIAPLVEALSAKLTAENGIPQERRKVVVTAGANMAFLNTIFAITDPGDEVILLAPFYFNHEMAVRLAGCTPRMVASTGSLRPDVAAIEHAICDRTRVVVTISPNNPTGVTYPEAELRAVNDVCRRHGLWHVSDEAYEYFVYAGARHFSPSSIEGSEPHTVSLFSLSKSYGFASWRIGYMVVPEALFEPVMKVQDTNVICAPVISQHAALACLEVGAAYPRSFLPGLEEVRLLALEGLGTLEDLVFLPKSDGAFYIYLRFNRPFDSFAVCRALIQDYAVAVVPGSAFGSTDGCYLRVSYGALDKASVAQGIGRLVDGLRALAARSGLRVG